jgi:hypothetical protein
MWSLVRSLIEADLPVAMLESQESWPDFPSMCHATWSAGSALVDYRFSLTDCQAIATVAASIQAGYYDVGLAGGVESMSLFERGREAGAKPLELARSNPDAMDCYLSMGQTSENVAARFGIRSPRHLISAVRSRIS